MIVEVYISSESYHEKFIPNGVNLIIYRVDNESELTIKLEDDGGKPILPFSFEMDYEELKREILKLDNKNEI